MAGFNGLLSMFSSPQLNPAAGSQYGLLDPQMQQQLKQQQLMGLAQGLLSASGPSTTPTSFGQAFGKGIEQSQKAGNDYQDSLIKQLTLTKALSGESPSAVREYEYYNNLDTKGKEAFLRVKRAQQSLNLGGSQVVLDPMGGVRETYRVTPKPNEMPDFKMQQAKSTEIGRQAGETASDLNAAESSMPQLEQAVKTLSDLGKKATYTMAGRGRDIAVRQSGLGATEGATARAAYIAHVKNNVLPLLRRTFGAQFTKAEGDSLLATLGDPNSSPQERDATLNAFIEDKRATLGTMRRQVGVNPTVSNLGQSDSRIQKAREAGYSDEEIQQYLRGR